MRRSHPLSAPRQRSFDDLETPLHEVTFCAVDLETTSGSWKDGEIVEIGAVKSRGGDTLGTFQTFVNPSVELPVEIQLLTGIRPSMLAAAPPLPVVLPTFLEFLGSSVFVAHNARFDRAFIDAACVRLDYDDLGVPIVDTARLARRLLKGDTPNCRLQTLAALFRTSHQPNHRAFPDAAACLEVLFALLERAAAYGITTLAELLELQKPSSNPHFEKTRLARDLPRRRGVYLFTNARGEVIYVGKATDLRSRVRSYFVTDERKRISDLRAEIAGVKWVAFDTEVGAEATEARLIERHAPRFNRRGVRRRSPVYLKLTRERHSRFSVVSGPKDDGALYLGPFSSRRRAQAAATTLAGLFGVRTCTLRLGPSARHEPCALYALGGCRGPCTGDPDDVAAHDDATLALRRDLDGGLAAAAGRLSTKLASLARRGRFEEAAEHRDAFEEVVRVVDRARTLRALTDAGRVELDTPDGRVTLDRGRFVAEAPTAGLPLESRPLTDVKPDPDGHALAPHGLEERKAVGAWLARAERLRLLSSSAPLSSPWPRARPVERIEL